MDIDKEVEDIEVGIETDAELASEESEFDVERDYEDTEFEGEIEVEDLENLYADFMEPGGSDQVKIDLDDEIADLVAEELDKRERPEES